MLSNLLNFFTFFTNRLRLSKPWKFKVPALITVFYFVLIMGDECYPSPLIIFLSSLMIIIGVAGIGYLTNDLGDIEKDRLISKPNATAQLSKASIILIFVLFLGFSLLPWYCLPFNYKSAALLCFQMLLFAAYAFRPFRLKEKGFLGIVTDALYAHTVPALLAAYTYFMAVQTPENSFWVFIALLCPWQFFLGLRNILIHQIFDYDNDLRSGTNTFVTRIGISRAQKLCNYFFYIEVIFFLLLVIYLSTFNGLFFAGPIVYWAIVLLRKRGILKKLSRKEFMYLFFDDLYLDWLPVFSLGLLVNIKITLILIAALHILLFRNRIKSYIINSPRIKRFFKPDSFHGKDVFRHVMAFGSYLCLFIAAYFYFDFSQEQQLYLSRVLVGLFLVHIILMLTFQYESLKNVLKSFFYETGSPVNLALFRIFIFLILTGHFIYIHQTQANWSFLSDGQRVELPFMGWLVSNLPVSPQLFKISCYCAAALAFFVSIGLFTRWAALALIPFAFYSFGVPMFYGKISHYHIMFWVPLIMCFAPLSDALSVDRLFIRKQARGEHVQSVSYALPFKFIWISLAIIYFFAGLHKLWESGLEWALGDSMINQIRWEWVENYDKTPGFRIDQYPVLAKTAGVLVIVFECLYPLLIFNKTFRLFALFGAFIMHLGIGYFMNIDFVFLRLLSLSYVDWNGVINWFRNKTASSQPNSTNSIITLTKRDKIGIYVSSLLIGVNFLCSTFKVHSYPFSSYPTYSTLVKNKIDILVMEPVEAHLTYSEIMKLAKSKKFRWESVRRLEQDLADKYLRNDTLIFNKELIAYWNIWRTSFDELKEIKAVKFYLKSYSIEPEKRNVVLDSIYLKEILIQPL